jgi:hypothetical protein
MDWGGNFFSLSFSFMVHGILIFMWSCLLLLILQRWSIKWENKSDHIFVCFYSFRMICYFYWFRPLCRFPVELQDTTSLEWFIGSLFMVTESVLLQILILAKFTIFISHMVAGARAECQLQLNNLHKRWL